VKKDVETLKSLLELVFKLMIDIDSDIDESWMRPKEKRKKKRKIQFISVKLALIDLFLQ
jgi:hypothetical protein